MSRTGDTDPSAHRNRKPLVASLVLLAALAVGLANRGDKEDASRVHFDSYPTAQARLGDLAKAHVDERKVTPKVKGEIEESLQAAVPHFQQHVSESVAALFSAAKSNSRTFKDPNQSEHERSNYQLYSSVNEDGEQVYTLEYSSSFKAPEIRDSDSEYLHVTAEKNGGMRILYKKAGRIYHPASFSSSDKLKIDSEGHVEVSDEFDTDGDPLTLTDSRESKISFDGNFSPGSHEGSRLEDVIGAMHNVDDLLARTAVAVAQS